VIARYSAQNVQLHYNREKIRAEESRMLQTRSTQVRSDDRRHELIQRLNNFAIFFPRPDRIDN